MKLVFPLQIVGVLILYSRIAEVGYEIKYGEKRDLSKWASKANLFETTIRSGIVTPRAQASTSSVA